MIFQLSSIEEIQFLLYLTTFVIGIQLTIYIVYQFLKNKNEGLPLNKSILFFGLSLIIIGEYGIFATIIAIFVNILLAGLILYLSRYFIKVLGDSGSKALSKITSLFLAAIAIMLMRKGLEGLLN